MSEPSRTQDGRVGGGYNEAMIVTAANESP